MRIKKWKIRKKMLLLLAACLCAGSLTGCANRTKIVFTTGLSGKQLFKIGSEQCTMPEMMIYLTTFYSRYTDIYGEKMWDYDFGGVTLESHVKEIVLSKMYQIKIMNLMAEERNLKLSASEEKRIASAVSEYEKKLGEELSEKEGITKKIIEKVYREYTTACKVYGAITEAENMEISDDEARTVTVQEILFPTWRISGGERIDFSKEQKEKVRKEAEAVLECLNRGEAPEAAVLQAGAGQVQTKSYARGETEKDFEEVLFAMDEEDISEIIETSDGYRIVKCIRTMDYEATQENKLLLAQKRRSKAFADAYREIEQNTPLQFRERAWENVSLKDDIYRTEADFFEIYNEYIKQ